MEDVSWFLGCCYNWQHTNDGHLTISITQMAKIESILDGFGIAECNATTCSFRSGTIIDRIPHDGVDPDAKPKLTTKPYQYSEVGGGGLNWLKLKTHPNLSVLVSLLSSHLHNASIGHLDTTKHILT
jgi:hypothetical protein